MQSVLDELIEDVKKSPRPGVEIINDNTLRVKLSQRSTQTFDFMHYSGFVPRKMTGSWNLRFHA